MLRAGDSLHTNLKSVSENYSSVSNKTIKNKYCNPFSG